MIFTHTHSNSRFHNYDNYDVSSFFLYFGSFHDHMPDVFLCMFNVRKKDRHCPQVASYDMLFFPIQSEFFMLVFYVHILSVSNEKGEEVQHKIRV